MTRGLFMIILVLTVAVVGIFVWTLKLHNDQMEFSGARSDLSVPSRDGSSARLNALEAKYLDLDDRVRAQGADIGTVEGRMERLEEGMALRDAQMVALVGGKPLPEGFAPLASSGGELRTAIEDVLAERDRKDRRERVERMASGMSRWLLSDIDVTDEQRKEFVSLISSFIEGRDRIRREYSEPDADTVARDNAISGITQDRDDGLLRLFGASNFAKIEERLKRTSRGFDGRGTRGGPRSGGRGRTR